MRFRGAVTVAGVYFEAKGTLGETQMTGKADKATRQRGAAAIEFALTFPLLFMLFYAILSYGMIFFVRMGLQQAAEDGARTALRYQSVTYTAGSSQVSRQQQQLQARITAATAVATAQAAWIKMGSTTATASTSVCVIGSNASGTDCAGYSGTMPTCGTDLNSACQVVVLVTYAYGSAPFIPALPGFNLLVPTTLRGQARVLVDGNSFSA
ncbi:Flp pilus assembly protein TadG [Solimonas aquatica]|uniref:Flp pilus assembly protein TadG n=2 Tax=Solimonas aquatica TaxID=489703 RepID=A0A1H9JPE7_9GAMM|nr:Flp pilus assembly protein TadG [Solimonas aquatica]